MEHEKQLMFSLTTGTFYEILKYELPVMDMFQIPLTRKPPTSCKKCYGRFYSAYNRENRIHLLCPSCKNKYIDHTKLIKD